MARRGGEEDGEQGVKCVRISHAVASKGERRGRFLSTTIYRASGREGVVGGWWFQTIGARYEHNQHNRYFRREKDTHACTWRALPKP